MQIIRQILILLNLFYEVIRILGERRTPLSMNGRWSVARLFTLLHASHYVTRGHQTVPRGRKGQAQATGQLGDHRDASCIPV